MSTATAPARHHLRRRLRPRPRFLDLRFRLSLPLNLGGGLAPGDALEEFKRGFANRTLAWRTSEVICDPERYADLSAGRSPTETVRHTR